MGLGHDSLSLSKEYFTWQSSFENLVEMPCKVIKQRQHFSHTDMNIVIYYFTSNLDIEFSISKLVL